MSKSINAPERIEIPRSGEDLWAYFDERERQDPILYKGFADMAAEAVDAVEGITRPWMEWETYKANVAVLPNRPEGIYDKELTAPSKEFIELFFATYNLHPVIDETSAKQPYGRILWSSEAGELVNLVESRLQDAKGRLFKFTIVGRVPVNLGRPYYPPETRKTIEETLELSRLSCIAMSAAREAQLDYWQLIHSLDTTEFESPYDQAA